MEHASHTNSATLSAVDAGDGLQSPILYCSTFALTERLLDTSRFSSSCTPAHQKINRSPPFSVQFLHARTLQHASDLSEKHMVPATFLLSHKGIMGLSMTIAVAGAKSSPHDSARAKQTQGLSGFEEATFLFFFLPAACLMCIRGHVRGVVNLKSLFPPTVLASGDSDLGTHLRVVETMSPSRIKTVQCSTARNSVRSAGAKAQRCRLTGELE